MIVNMDSGRNIAVDIAYSNKASYRRSTTVTISNVSGGEHVVLGVGVAVCSEDDNFSKSTGRVIAFQRALIDYNPPYRFVIELINKLEHRYGIVW